jgi:hypothetical protein
MSGMGGGVVLIPVLTFLGMDIKHTIAVSIVSVIATGERSIELKPGPQVVKPGDIAAVRSAVTAPASAADDKMEEDYLVAKARMAFDGMVD